MNTHDYIWAKQDGISGTYPLLAHLLDTATIAGILYDRWLRQGLQELIDSELGGKGKKIFMWMAATHDIGKASPLFQYQPRQRGPEWDAIRQAYTADSVGCSFGSIEDLKAQYEFSLTPGTSFLRRHEQIGAFALMGRVPESASSASRAWSYLPAMGHHGSFKFLSFGGRASAKTAQDILTNLGWAQAQQDLLQIVAEALEVEPATFPKKVSPTVTILLSGLLILADRLASGTDWVERNQQRLSNQKISLNQPQQWIHHLSQPAFERVDQLLGIYRGWGEQHDALAAILGGHSPRPLQQEALKTGAGIWNAMAPTGNGKTEAAALRHSLADERLIFLLPTQATSNALMRRVQKMYSSTKNVASLAHGLASIEDFYNQPVTDYADTCEGQDAGGLYPTEFVKSGASRLLAPVCVGTVDQALMSAIPLKWTHLRLLALANSHIVIDEIHTLDHYQSEILVPLLKWLGQTKTRVTFLSATFPSWQRARFLEAYSGQAIQSSPAFPAAESLEFNEAAPRQVQLTDGSGGNEYTIDFTFAEPPFEELEATHITWAEERRKKFPLARLGIICNTVARAQKVAEELTAGGEKVILLHSRMTAEHRRINAELLEELIGSGGEGSALTVVGTQAIEASLDIDLDILSTDLCPAPSLIQRAGRVWRHQDARRLERVSGLTRLTINVLKPAAPEKHQLLPYSEAELGRTWDYLQEHQAFHCPTDNQEFVDKAAVTLETIGENLDRMEADLDHIALDSHKIQRGRDRARAITAVIKETSRLNEFEAFTDPQLKDKDDTAFTRLIEAEVRQVIVGGPHEQVPGGWEGSYQGLLALTSHQQEKLRQALKASMPIPVNSKTRDLLSTALSLENSPSLLKRYLFLPVPQGLIYDPVLGFIGDDK